MVCDLLRATLLGFLFTLLLLFVGHDRDAAVGGEIEYWNGSDWVSFEEWSNPGVPLGDAPWHWMLLLALGYGIAKMRLRKRIHG